MIKLCVVTLGFLFLLAQGCVTTATTGANLLYDRTNTGNSIENVYDTQSTELALNRHQNLKKNSRIAAVSFNNTLLLIGQTTTPQFRQQAEDIVKKRAQVNTVANNITIQKPLSKTAQLHDAWITTKIVTQITFNFSMNPRTIKVVTEDGVVYLLGNLTEKQASIATNIAKKTDGVKKVVQLIRYVYYV